MFLDIFFCFSYLIEELECYLMNDPDSTESSSLFSSGDDQNTSDEFHFEFHYGKGTVLTPAWRIRESGRLSEKLHKDYDLIFMPSYEIQNIGSNTIDLFINMCSLGEMDRDAAKNYVQHITKSSKWPIHVVSSI